MHWERTEFAKYCVLMAAEYVCLWGGGFPSGSKDTNCLKYSVRLGDVHCISGRSHVRISASGKNIIHIINCDLLPHVVSEVACGSYVA
jgi:hypothetical protein